MPSLTSTQEESAPQLTSVSGTTPSITVRSSEGHAFSSLYPFAMNTVLRLDADAREYDLKEPTDIAITYSVLNIDRKKAVWFPNELLNQTMLIYGLKNSNEWFSLPSTMNGLTPHPQVLGPLPSYSPLASGILILPQGVLAPKVPTKLRILVWGYLLGVDSQPTTEQAGAFADVTVIDER